MILLYYWINQLKALLFLLSAWMTRQLVKMGDKAMNRNGVATLKLHHAAVSLPTPNVCVVISTSDAVFVCVRVRFDCGGSAQIGCSEEGGKQTKGGGEETVGGRGFNQRHAMSIFPRIQSPIYSIWIASQLAHHDVCFVAYGGRGTPLYVCSHSYFSKE